MSLWETVFNQVKDEMPHLDFSRRRSWPSFIGAAIVALIILCIWFPIRLIAELLKAVDLSDKPDHRTEALALFKEAQSLSLDLPSKSEFARSVLQQLTLPTSLHNVWHKILRQLYAENMPLEISEIPDDLEGLDGVRWRDQTHRDITRMKGNALTDMRHACSLAVSSALSDMPNIAGQGEVTAPLKNLCRERQSKLFSSFVGSRGLVWPTVIHRKNVVRVAIITTIEASFQRRC